MIRHRNCKDCKDYEAHNDRYILALQKYENDADNQAQKKNDADTNFCRRSTKNNNVTPHGRVQNCDVLPATYCF